MLKRRLILTLTINDGQLYRTKHFRPDRSYSLDFVDLQGADEIVVLDVSASGEGRGKFLGVVEKLSQELFLPLAVGGWVDSWGYARELMNAGADKIILNEFGHPSTDAETWCDLTAQLSRKLGSSCVVARASRWLNMPEVVLEAGVRSMVDMGAGEILYQNPEYDGSLLGYDLDSIRTICGAVNIPIIAMSGCGTAQHMVDAFNAGASACATSNIFHFTPSHVKQFKRVIEGAGIPMRT